MIWDRPELLELRDGELVAYDVARSDAHRRGFALRLARRMRFGLAVPGAHNALNAAAALEAASLAGAEPERAIAGLAGFTGRRPALSAGGRDGGRWGGVRGLRPPPHRARGDPARGAHVRAPAGWWPCSSPTSTRAPALLAREFGDALALADVAVVLDVYPARERAEDFPGVSGLTIAQAAADAAGGRPVMWLPTFADALPVLRGLLVEGDLCLVMGAGDVDALGRHLVEAPAMSRCPEHGPAEGGAGP